MSSPPPLTFLLEHQQRLHVDCCRCGRKLEFTADEAIKTFGADMTMPRLARILKCSACNARGRDAEISVYPDTNDFYASIERQRHERNIILYGEAGADLIRSYQGRLGETRPRRDG